MVIKKKNRIRLFLFSALMMFSMCFFFSTMSVKACGSVNLEIGAVGDNVVNYETEPLPPEITQPIEKGMSLLEYLIITLGGVVVLVGIVLLAISFFGHQNDMKITGFIALGAGLVIMASPQIVDWLKG